MKKIFFISSWFIFLTIVCVSQCFASSVLSKEDIIKKFNKSYPTIPIDSAVQSPIEGLFEIISGDKIAYYYPEKNILIIGNMIQDGKNLTNQKMIELQARMIALQSEKGKTIPLDKALRIGAGKHKVIEFTDPDCPFCRQAAEYFNSRADVTKYVFFLPLTNMHPQAEIKAKYVLDAQDKEKAYKEAMSGGLDQKDLTQQKFSERANAWLSEHMDIAVKLGINSTPTFWIDGQYVQGADIRMFNQILGENKEAVTGNGKEE